MDSKFLFFVFMESIFAEKSKIKRKKKATLASSLAVKERSLGEKLRFSPASL